MKLTAWIKSLFQPSIIVPTDAVEFPDVSFYQGVIDFDKMALNTDAIIIRLGQNTWEDTEFERNYAEAKARGLKVGGYWFFDGRSSATTQANLIKSLMVGKSFEMELFIDWERNYNGAYEGLKEVVALMQAVESVDCFDVGLYTGYYWFIANSNATTHASQYNYLKNKPLWLAWYTTNPANVKIPPPWTTWEHWQYGTPAVGNQFGAATIELDMNKHNGDLSKYGAVTPPGGTMKEGTALVDLNIRSGVYPATVVGILNKGDKAYGVIDPVSGWLIIQWIVRVGGARQDFTGWCSALPQYLSVVDYVPAAGLPDIPYIINLGDDVTYVKQTITGILKPVK